MARILVVEDDEQLLGNICEQLELDKHETRSATNGIEALEILVSFTPQLILCDISMPKMDGINFIRAVKRNASYAYIPFIFLTAKASNEDLIEGLEEGAVDYLIKPFLYRVLQLKINNIISHQTDYLLNRIDQESDLIPNFKFLQKFTNQLEINYEDSSLTIEQMAHIMNMSVSTLQRHLKDQYKKNFGDILKSYRLRKATTYLIQSDESIQTIATRSGFSSLSYFSICFKEVYHISPLRFRAANQGK